MHKYIFIIPVLLFSCSAPQPQGVEVIGTEHFLELIEKEKDLVIIDVRTPGETSQGMIPGAVNLDWQDPSFETEISKLDPGKPVVVYCASGIRSAQAARKLEENNFGIIYDYADGYFGWVRRKGE